jgi:hypothetical protein
LTHALLSAVWGTTLPTDGWRLHRAARVGAGAAAAAALHGIYDYFALSPHGGLILASALTLALWLAFYRAVAGAESHPTVRGAIAGGG